MNKKSNFIFLLLFSFLFACQDDPIEPNEPVGIITAEVVIDSVYQITQLTAKISLNVISSGNSFVSARGLCISRNPSPDFNDTVFTIGNGIGTYQVDLNNLEPNSTYFIRAFCTNSEATVYSAQQTFITLSNLYSMGDGVTDVDGNFYPSILINGQEWMQANLKTTKYANGDTIQKSHWIGINYEAYSTNYNAWTGGFDYGNSYNYYAVIDNRNVCPSNWHVPSLAEWNTLISNLGGANNIGTKIKKEGGEWIGNNSNITNSSGFSALPGGYTENVLAKVNEFPQNGYWWTSSDAGTNTSNAIKIDYLDDNIDIIEQIKGYGSSIRCIKD